MVVECSAGSVDRRVEPGEEGLGAALGARRGDDHVQEGGERLAALQVNLDPERDRICQPRPRLAQQPGGGLESIGDSFQALGEGCEVTREEGVADLRGGVAAPGPGSPLGQLVQLQPGFVHQQVAVQRVRWGEVVHAESVHLGHGGTPEVDALFDRLAGGALEAVVVLVNPNEAREGGLQPQPVAEPAIDRALEASIGVRDGEGHREARLANTARPRGGRSWRRSPTIRGRWPPPRSAGPARASDAVRLLP